MRTHREQKHTESPGVDLAKAAYVPFFSRNTPKNEHYTGFLSSGNQLFDLPAYRMGDGISGAPLCLYKLFHSLKGLSVASSSSRRRQSEKSLTLARLSQGLGITIAVVAFGGGGGGNKYLVQATDLHLSLQSPGGVVWQVRALGLLQTGAWREG